MGTPASHGGSSPDLSFAVVFHKREKNSSLPLRLPVWGRVPPSTRGRRLSGKATSLGLIGLDWPDSQCLNLRSRNSHYLVKLLWGSCSRRRALAVTPVLPGLLLVCGPPTLCPVARDSVPTAVDNTRLSHSYWK